MKRSYVLSALVLGLALSTTACGGGSADGKPAEGAEGQQGGDSGKPPAEQLKAMSEDIQKAVDDLLSPIDKADAAIEAVANLPKELKATIKGKAKLDPKKLGAAAQKIVNGEDPGVADLGLEAEAEAKAKVEDAFNKLKDVVKAIKETDEKAKALGEKIKGAIVSVPGLATKVIAEATLVIKNPLKGADAKAKAQADMDTVKGIADGFVKKAEEWQKKIVELPARAKAASEKMAKSFTSMK
jgi:uncharacterized coiled-coil DUF342 family protein